MATLGTVRNQRLWRLLASAMWAYVVYSHAAAAGSVADETMVAAGRPQACELALFPVLRGVGDAVRVNVSFIADVGAGGTTCAGGPRECDGDTQQLCAAGEAAAGTGECLLLLSSCGALHCGAAASSASLRAFVLLPSSHLGWTHAPTLTPPPRSPHANAHPRACAGAFLDFVVCQSMQQELIPGNAAGCAAATGLNWTALRGCAESARGEALLTGMCLDDLIGFVPRLCHGLATAPAGSTASTTRPRRCRIGGGCGAEGRDAILHRTPGRGAILRARRWGVGRVPRLPEWRGVRWGCGELPP
jgi:hypothetical protein